MQPPSARGFNRVSCLQSKGLAEVALEIYPVIYDILRTAIPNVGSGVHKLITKPLPLGSVMMCCIRNVCVCDVRIKREAHQKDIMAE